MRKILSIGSSAKNSLNENAFFKKFVPGPLILVVFLYILSVLMVGPMGNFAINDDWIFALQVRSFLYGDFRLSALIDPTFLSQGFLGFVWAMIFSSTFTSLRFLTMLVTIISATGFFLCLRELNVTKSRAYIFIFLYLFNPIVFFSSFTFMTENYFALFFIWSLYFFLKYFNEDTRRYFFIALVFALFAFLTRQLGIFIFFAYLMTLILPIFRSKNPMEALKSIEIKNITNILLVALFGIILWLIWPSYASLDPSADKFGGLIEVHLLRKRLTSLYWLFPSLGFFFVPLVPFLMSRIFGGLKNVKSLLLFVFANVGLSYWIYNLDVFPLGNVFYLEGLYLKTDFRINFSLLDNVPVRIIFSVLIALSLILLFIFFTKYFKKYYSKAVDSNIVHKNIYHFMFSLLLLLSGFLVVSSDFYERYLLPVFIVLLLIIASYKPQITYNKKTASKILTYVLLLVFALTSILLNQDYMENTRLRWQIARAISRDSGLVTDIYVSGPYGKYMKALTNEDFTGLSKSDPSGNYICFVQEYTLDPDDSLVFDITNSLNKKLADLLPINKAPDTRKNSEIPRVKKNMDELSYDYGYKSYIYNLVGKSAGVGGWCAFSGDD